MWVREGASSPPRTNTLDEFPWLLSRVFDARELVALTRLDELPLEAARDRATLERNGVISGALAPMINEDRVIGELMFATSTREQRWSPDLVARLRLLGAIIASALGQRDVDLSLRAALAENERLRDRLAAENLYLQAELVQAHDFGDIVGQSPALRAALGGSPGGVQAAYEYYAWLGFGLSETIEDAQTLYAAWMFRKQTVHDVAFTGGAGPRLHHLGFFAPRVAPGAAHLRHPRLAARGGHIERGPGRHGVSNAFYVYLRDPDGHRVEIYTSDYYTGDPDHPVLRWDVSDPRRRSFYGHAVVPSWYAEASTVLDLDGLPRPVSDQHQILEYSVGADGFPVR